MARNYSPITNPLPSNRLLSKIKKTIDRAENEESTITNAYDYFKQAVDDNPSDAASKSAMVDCLKLLQSSKATIAKLVVAAEKINSSESKKNSSDSEDSVDLFKSL